MAKRILSWILVAFGILGMVGCLEAMIVATQVKGRLDRASRGVVATIRDALGAAEQRTVRVQRRVDSLRITSEEVRQTVESWAKSETRDLVVSRTQIESATARLEAGVEQANQWLEIAQSSVQLVQEVFEVERSFGEQASLEATERLLTELASLRDQLAASGERLKQMLSGMGEGDAQADPNRFREAVEIASRLIATVTSIDGQLQRLREELTSLQDRLRDVESRLDWWLQVALIGVIVLLGWIAAGQVALATLGWRGIRRGVAPNSVAGNPTLASG